MIALLSGLVAEREEKALIIDVNGIGYRVLVSAALREKFPLSTAAHLRIYHHISDSGQLLFGFADKEDLYYFELLLTVPSVGPRTAMNILDIAPKDVLEQAVAAEDTALLTKVSGIGKRTAERIVMELKNKIKPTKKSGVPGTLQQETIEALVSIGYTPAQARTAAGRLPNSVKTVEEAVRIVLQNQS